MDSIYSKMMMSLHRKSLLESKQLKEDTVNDIDNSDETEVPAEGTVTDVVAVVDPDLSSDDYEKVIDKAEEIIDETPDGEQPTDEQYIGQNIYTCPICGNAFFTDVELGEGDACPVCSEVPEAFIFNGKVEGDITEEDEEMLDNLEDNVEDEEIPNDENKEEEISDNEEDLEEPSEESEEEEVRNESLNLKNVAKRLNEVRRVEKKRIVVAYDFNELDEKVQEMVINRYKRRNNIKDDSTYEDIIKDKTKLELINKLSKLSFIDREEISNIKVPYYICGNNGSKEDRLKDMESYFSLPYSINLKDLHPDLENEEGYTDSEIKFYEDIKGYNGFEDVVLRTLYNRTNYPEISKSSKKEIQAKINKFIEDVCKIYEEVADYCDKLKDENVDSISELKRLRNEPIIKELSNKWYTEDGSAICSKKDAKVVKTESINESLLTEAPVNLEFDDSFDVYSYDELDDRAKERAFSDKKHLANNLYGKRWPALREQIKQQVEEYFEKQGISNPNVDVDDEIIYVDINSDDLEKYAKSNGIDTSKFNKKMSRARVRIGMVGSPKFTTEVSSGYSYFDNGLSDEEYKEVSSTAKELEKELKMDLEGIYNQIQRTIKKAHDQADSDYRDKMSKQRKEYTKDGREYKGD